MSDLANIVLTDAIRPIWHLHGRDEHHPNPVLKVYSHKYDPPVWYKDLTTAVDKNRANIQEGLDDQGALVGDIIKGKDQVGRSFPFGYFGYG